MLRNERVHEKRCIAHLHVIALLRFLHQLAVKLVCHAVQFNVPQAGVFSQSDLPVINGVQSVVVLA
jgi:hypothetical protein